MQRSSVRVDGKMILQPTSGGLLCGILFRPEGGVGMTLKMSDSIQTTWRHITEEGILFITVFRRAHY